MARRSGKTGPCRTREIDSFCSLVNYSITILGQEFDPGDSYWVCEGSLHGAARLVRHARVAVMLRHIF